MGLQNRYQFHSYYRLSHHYHYHNQNHHHNQNHRRYPKLQLLHYRLIVLMVILNVAKIKKLINYLQN